MRRPIGVQLATCHRENSRINRPPSSWLPLTVPLRRRFAVGNGGVESSTLIEFPASESFPVTEVVGALYSRVASDALLNESPDAPKRFGRPYGCTGQLREPRLPFAGAG
jgi:hypothetical protein